MATDTKHQELQGLRIDRSAPAGEPSSWARRFIIIGISLVVLLGLGTLLYRTLAAGVPEVSVARASAQTSGDAGSIVLSATGYIVAHHKINVNTKVTGRVK